MRITRMKPVLNYSTRVHYASTDSLAKTMHGCGELNQIMISDQDSSNHWAPVYNLEVPYDIQMKGTCKIRLKIEVWI